jgi:beta-ureidopropionase
MRPPRVVRAALVQNKIVLPTDMPFSDQKKAIMDRIGSIIDAAGSASVNVLCLQVHWIQECLLHM